MAWSLIWKVLRLKGLLIAGKRGNPEHATVSEWRPLAFPGVHFDKQTWEGCIGTIAPPWVASCGRMPVKAGRHFVEALRATTETAR
jgi:hypothetical protein